MKKTLYLILSFLLHSITYAQAENPNPLNPLIESSSNSENYGERLLLYQIDLDDLSIPIEISYNHNGFMASQAPNSLGLGWSLNDIGKINREVKHLPDDYKVDGYLSSGGWFNTNSSALNNYTGTNTPNHTFALGLLRTVDQMPDFFSLNLASKIRSVFVYDKQYNGNDFSLSPLVLETNKNLIINTNFNNLHYGVNNFLDTAINIEDEDGFLYDFIGGPAKKTISRNSDTAPKAYKDYYLSKIRSSRSSDVITLSYLEKNYEQYHYFEDGHVNSSSNLNYISYSDYSYIGESTLEINKIVTPRETIQFNYSNIVYPPLNAYSSYNIPILNEIIVNNPDGGFITGYFFEYHTYTLNNRPLLKRVYKYNKSKTNKILLREYEYHGNSDLNWVDDIRFITSIDAFGFFNHADNTGLLPFNVKWCGSTATRTAANRIPNLEAAQDGVLRKSTNNLGGTTEYTYQLNADSELYGGGLRISKIINNSNTGIPKTTTFEYQNLTGFAIGLTNPQNNFRGTLTGIRYPLSGDLMHIYDQDQESTILPFQNYAEQGKGNFFKRMIVRTFVENSTLSNYPVEVYTNDEYTFVSNFRGNIRTPLLKSKISYKEFIYNSEELASFKLNETIYEYGLFSTKHIPAKTIYTNYAGCNGSSYFNNINLFNTWIHKIEQPLKTITTKNYKDHNTFIETKKELVYFGENGTTYDFNSVRIKEIKTTTNNFPVSKQKFKYLIEYFSPTAGLSGLSAYNNPNKTLLVEQSNWTLDKNQQWVLNKASFNQYYNDGKLKLTSATQKKTNNTLFNESDFNPYFSNGTLVGVPLLNNISYTYDANGRVSQINDLSANVFKRFSRTNESDPYTINTILEGNSTTAEYDFYRNSFEKETGTNYILSNAAYTGSKVFNGVSLALGSFPANYIVSFWYYKDNKWSLQSYNHTGGTVTITKPTGADFIDEVWIRPKNTILKGKTFNAYYETSHLIEDNGFTLKNIFDEYGRLIKQIDKDGYIINERKYNFIKE